MIWGWWDDAVAWANLMARGTRLRQKVSYDPVGRGWTVDLAAQHLDEVCS